MRTGLPDPCHTVLWNVTLRTTTIAPLVTMFVYLRFLRSATQTLGHLPRVMADDPKFVFSRFPLLENQFSILDDWIGVSFFGSVLSLIAGFHLTHHLRKNGVLDRTSSWIYGVCVAAFVVYLPIWWHIPLWFVD